MSQLNTARGTIDTADIGTTLMHEHVFLMTTEIAQNYPDEWGDEDARVADAINRLNELKAAGVDTIVDLTVIGLGRYIPRISRVAAGTELNIVVATGIYTYNDVPFYYHYRGPGTLLDGPDIMAEMFVRDIETGIADTGVKAAILKCATDEPGVTPASSGCCARWPPPTARPACRSPPTPTPAPAAAWSSSASSPRRAWTCPGW